MFDAVIGPELLRLNARAAWLFGCTAAAATAAAGGWALRHLLDGRADRVIHLAADMVVFAPLLPLLADPVVVVPRHLAVAATPAAQQAREALAQAEGLYDPGLLAVSADKAGRAFAQWWAARLEGFAEPGKPLDLAPSLFAAGISRDPGCDVAAWNIADRPIGVDAAGNFTVDGGRPLRCLRPAGMTAADSPTAGELAAWHAEEIRKAAAALPPPAPWAWSRFDDGTPIPDAARALYRSRPDLKLAFPNPFAAGPVSFQGWLATEQPEPTA
jgi:hypothetical protein